ncbi:hypothetical protein Tco_0324888 [Tanacetum coccineum]
MAQQVILAAQTVPIYHTIRRCNNYAMLQSIPFSKVPNTEDTIKLTLDTKEFTYTVDMFRDTLHFPMETPVNLFVAPKKEAIRHPRFIKLIIANLMKKFPNIPQRIKEDYHSIKDDIPLVSVYTTGNVLVQGMLIPDEFLTKEIRATDDFKEYETVFMKVVVSTNQPQPVVSTQGTHRSTPRGNKTHIIFTASPQGKKRKQSVGESSLVAEAQENIAKVQENLDEEEIEKMDKAQESYETSRNITDDDEEIEKEKKDEEIKKEKNDDNVEKTDEVVKEKDIFNDATVSEELTATVSPITTTTSKDLSTSKCKKRSISNRIKILLGSIAGMCRRHVETPVNLFVVPVNNQAIEAFMNRVGYQVVVDKKKEAIRYPRFIKLIIAYLMKKFSNIPQRIKEDYHSIKDDIPLVSVYTTGNVLVRGMLIRDEFLTEEIRATDDFKEYEMVFMKVVILTNQPQLVVSTQGTHRSTPRANKTPIVFTASPQGKKRKQSVGESKNLDEEEIEKMVEGEEDEESYASVFVDSVFNDHTEKEKKDEEIEKEKNDDNGEKTDEVVKGKDIVDDAIVSEELTATISPITTTTSKDLSTSKRKIRSISNRTKILLGRIASMCRRRGQIRSHIRNKFTWERFEKFLIIATIKKDREVSPNITLNLYPTTSSSTAEKSSADLKHQLYLSMESKTQDQAAYLEIWEILKAKFEKQ